MLQNHSNGMNFSPKNQKKYEFLQLAVYQLDLIKTVEM